MERKRINEYHKYGCHFHGKLVVISYMDDAKKDNQWGTFNAGVSLDYYSKALSLVKETYGENIEVLLGVPELGIRIKD